MIRLTDDQLLEIDGGQPPRAVDPKTNTHYVLIRAEVYERLKPLFDGVPVSELEETALIRETGLLAGWDDPELDVYNELDPRRQ